MERYNLNAVPNASSEAAGVLRVANEVDEKNSGCTDAAITPSNLHNMVGYRKANTEYKGNEVVGCPCHIEFLLKCVQAGTTSTSPLDTTNVTKGQVITDGGVKWEVIAKAVIDTRVTGEIINVIFADGTVKEIKPYSNMTDYITESYRSGTEWYRKWNSGWLEQGGYSPGPEKDSYKITLLKPFADTNYCGQGTGCSSASTGDGWGSIHNKTTTSFNIAKPGSGVMWYVYGQGA